MLHWQQANLILLILRTDKLSTTFTHGWPELVEEAYAWVPTSEKRWTHLNRRLFKSPTSDFLFHSKKRCANFDLLKSFTCTSKYFIYFTFAFTSNCDALKTHCRKFTFKNGWNISKTFVRPASLFADLRRCFLWACTVCENPSIPGSWNTMAVSGRPLPAAGNLKTIPKSIVSFAHLRTSIKCQSPALR